MYHISILILHTLLRNDMLRVITSQLQANDKPMEPQDNMKLRAMKTFILNFLLSSSLIILGMLMVKFSPEDILDLVSNKLERNASQFYFYSKEDPETVDIEMLCQNIKTHRTKDVTVWKTALSLTEVVPTDLDIAYHAYIVYQTEDPMGVTHYWSQEKLRHSLLMQHSTNKDDVVKRIRGHNRVGHKAWKKEPEILLRERITFDAVPQYGVLS